MSRIAYNVSEEYAKEIFTEETGLPEESKDGVSIPMNRSVRYIILILLRRYFGATGRGFELLPATDVPQLVGALSELLAKAKMPSAEHSFRSICKRSGWMSVSARVPTVAEDSAGTEGVDH